MVLKDLRELLRIQVDDVEADRFTDYQLKLLLNRGLQKTWKEILKLGVWPKVVDGSVSFTSDSQVSIIQDEDNNDALNVQKVFLVQGQNITMPRKIQIIPETQSRQLYERETVFFRKPNKLGWYQTPTKSMILDVSYVPVVTLFGDNEDSEVTDIEDHFSDVVVNWATVLALGVDEDNLNTWVQIYQNSLQDLIDTYPGENEADQIAVQRYNG